MDDFEYEEIQWSEEQEYLDCYDHLKECQLEFDFVYDQKFTDTLAWIQAKPEVK